MTTLHESGLFNFPPELHGLGMQIHIISMILFASIIFVRFYYLVQIRTQNYRNS